MKYRILSKSSTPTNYSTLLNLAPRIILSYTKIIHFRQLTQHNLINKTLYINLHNINCCFNIVLMLFSDKIYAQIMCFGVSKYNAPQNGSKHPVL